MTAMANAPPATTGAALAAVRAEATAFSESWAAKVGATGGARVMTGLPPTPRIADFLDAIRAARMGGPVGPMHVVARLPQPMQSQVLNRMARNASSATRKSVVAASNMVFQWAPAARGEMLRTILAASPCREPWSAAITIAWLTGSHAVVSGARTRKGLGLWLDHARLNAPFPFLSHLFANVVDELPETVLIYRGGVVGATPPLAEGHSWTLRPSVACAYAALRAMELGLPPVVIEATIPRAAVKFATRGPCQEIALIEPPDNVAVHLSDPSEIATRGEAEIAGRKHVPLMNGLYLDSRDEACWAGWKG